MPKDPKWTYERETLLIDFFAQNRLLWDPKHPKHRMGRRSVVMDALVDLLDNVFTVEDISKRFVALRSTFRENHKKATTRKSGCSTDEVYVPSWSHYSRLTFLADTFSERNSRSSLGLEDSQLSPSDHLQSFMNTGHDTRTEDTYFVDVNADVCVEAVKEEEPQSRRSIAKGIPPHSRSHSTPSSSEAGSPVEVTQRSQRFDARGGSAKRKSVGIDGTGEDFYELAKAKLFHACEPKIQDEYTGYGQHVENQLRALGSLNAAMARIEIENVLFKYNPANPNNPNNAPP